MINIKRGLELYNIVCKLMKGYNEKPSAEGITKYIEQHGITVHNIEDTSNAFDIDIGIICITFDKTLVPEPTFLIQVEEDFETVGGWVSYDTKTGYIKFPFISKE